MSNEILTFSSISAEFLVKELALGKEFNLNVLFEAEGQDGVLLRSFKVEKNHATGYDTFEELQEEVGGEKWLISSLFQYTADMNSFDEVEFAVDF